MQHVDLDEILVWGEKKTKKTQLKLFLAHWGKHEYEFFQMAMVLWLCSVLILQRCILQYLKVKYHNAYKLFSNGLE